MVKLNGGLFDADVLERVIDERASTSVDTRSITDSILEFLSKELPSIRSTAGLTPATSHSDEQRPHKRRRTSLQQPAPQTIDEAEFLLKGELFDSIVEAHFLHVHPWIPMVHPGRFRFRLQNPNERPRLDVLCRAMALSAWKFVPSHDMSTREVDGVLERLRSSILSTALESLSLEGLQSLIIVAFNDVRY
jgi:hypothetical protein